MAVVEPDGVSEDIGPRSLPLLNKLGEFSPMRHIITIDSNNCSIIHNRRMLCYAITGICVIIMPAFMAECAPAILRGMVTTQLQLQIVVAKLFAAAINYRTSTISLIQGGEDFQIRIIQSLLSSQLEPNYSDLSKIILNRNSSNKSPGVMAT
ncbi:hypothetical protein BDZ45DRAFT_742015 [Acephala macrosclerotiorum]|nr:hypothetical protein BDZ45DRAFT_742015 [Acephala macrosclerotiorum]